MDQGISIFIPLLHTRLSLVTFHSFQTTHFSSPLVGKSDTMRLSVLLKLALTGLVQAKYWMEDIGHHGISPYHNSGVDFPVFRNVKDFGAVGDGGKWPLG